MFKGLIVVWRAKEVGITVVETQAVGFPTFEAARTQYDKWCVTNADRNIELFERREDEHADNKPSYECVNVHRAEKPKKSRKKKEAVS